MQDWIDDLRAILGDRLSLSSSDRDQHGRDPGHPDGAAPDAVAYPLTTGDVAAIAKCCTAHCKPMIPYGVGSSLESQVSAPHGGLCIDLGRMTRIVAVNAADMDVRVEAGVTREQLNTELRDTGLFFPIDPGADASLGGMAATRASGTNAVRYGTMRPNVMGLTVVTPSGEVIRTGSRARKSSAGYDLTALYVGSEGTIGIITEVLLRLHPIPERIAAAVVPFPALGPAVDCVIQILQLAVPMARMELLDEVQMRAIHAYSHGDHAETPTLFLEFHGGPASVDEQIETAKMAVEQNGGGPFTWADRTEDRAWLWKARHDAYWAAMALRPGARMITTDVCVPISRLTELIVQTRADFDARDLTAPILGHVGDGNFHAFILFDPEDVAETAAAHAANNALLERALDMGGTSTGEHGIGIGKRTHLLSEHGDGVALMRALKNTLDPLKIMNPGKIFLEE
jgi:D-lactate dehydrogenase (cytochrome)